MLRILIPKDYSILYNVSRIIYMPHIGLLKTQRKATVKISVISTVSHIHAIVRMLLSKREKSTSTWHSSKS